MWFSEFKPGLRIRLELTRIRPTINKPAPNETQKIKFTLNFFLKIKSYYNCYINKYFVITLVSKHFKKSSFIEEFQIFVFKSDPNPTIFEIRIRIRPKHKDSDP